MNRNQLFLKWNRATGRTSHLFALLLCIIQLAAVVCGLLTGRLGIPEAVIFGLMVLLCGLLMQEHVYSKMLFGNMQQLIKTKTYASIGLLINAHTNRADYLIWKCFEGNDMLAPAVAHISDSELDSKAEYFGFNRDDYFYAFIDANSLAQGDREYERLLKYKDVTLCAKLEEGVSVASIPYEDNTECWFIKGMDYKPVEQGRCVGMVLSLSEDNQNEDRHDQQA